MISPITKFFAQHFITKLLKESYPSATHGIALKCIMTTILKNQRENFREDNEATTVDYLVEQLVKSSELKPVHPMYQKLLDVKICSRCQGRGIDQIPIPDTCSLCYGSGINP
jgi:hypothetical protein